MVYYGVERGNVVHWPDEAKYITYKLQITNCDFIDLENDLLN